MSSWQQFLRTTTIGRHKVSHNCLPQVLGTHIQEIRVGPRPADDALVSAALPDKRLNLAALPVVLRRGDQPGDDPERVVRQDAIVVHVAGCWGCWGCWGAGVAGVLGLLLLVLLMLLLLLDGYARIYLNLVQISR